MENSSNQLSESEIFAFATLQYGINHNDVGKITEGLENLKRFGSDIKQIDLQIKRVLEKNPRLKEDYGETYKIIEDISKFILQGNPRKLAETFGTTEEDERRDQKNAIDRRRLENQLAIETAHLGDFRGRLVEYLWIKAFHDYKQGVLAGGKKCMPNPEFESYIKTSRLSKQFYDLIMDCMPALERGK